MEKSRFVVFRWLEHLLVLGMTAMCLLVFWNVVLRYGLRSGIPISVEVSRLIFVWIIMLGSVLALREGLHISVDALVSRMQPRLRVASLWVSHMLMLWCCWLVLQGSLRQAQVNWSNQMPLSGVSVGWMYAAGIAAAVFWAMILLFNLYRSARGDHSQLQPNRLPTEGHGQ